MTVEVFSNASTFLEIHLSPKQFIEREGKQEQKELTKQSNNKFNSTDWSSEISLGIHLTQLS